MTSDPRPAKRRRSCRHAHQIRDRLDAQCRIGHQHVAVGGQHRDVGEVLERIVADVGIDCRPGQVRARACIH